MKPMLLTIFSFLLSLPLLSMPTAEEIAAAEPLVQEVMKAEMDALRSGKKTREQVGDAAVALAKAAQAPAEKYILLTGAFDYYMRGGSYDKAASALEAVRKAIPDWKGSDEFALIDKAMRVVAFGKGGPVRERYEELKERQQYALRLRKALEQAKAKPSDKKLQFQVATYSAALGHWPQAVDAFLAANNPACAAAAKLEKESAPPAKVADAWWSVVDIRPAFLSSAIRAHAVDLYKKALDSNSLAGLQKVAAEKRIQEAQNQNVPEEKESVAKTGSESSEWVYCPGGAFYLDTGIVPKSTMTIEWDVRFPNTYKGNRNFSGANATGRGACINTGTKNVEIMEFYDEKWQNGAEVDKCLKMDSSRRNKIVWNASGISVNGSLVAKAPLQNCSASLVLFDRNRGGKPGGSSSECWVYGLKIRDGNRVLLDYRPKVKGGVSGFSDKVSGRFVSPSVGQLKFGKD